MKRSSKNEARFQTTAEREPLVCNQAPQTKDNFVDRHERSRRCIPKTPPTANITETRNECKHATTLALFLALGGLPCPSEKTDSGRAGGVGGTPANIASQLSIARRTLSSRCWMAVCWNEAARSALVDSGSAALVQQKGVCGDGWSLSRR